MLMMIRRIVSSLAYAIVLTVAISATTAICGEAEAERMTQPVVEVTEEVTEVAEEPVVVEAIPEPEPYDADYVLRVITAEGGTDQLVCNGVAQCLYNACERDLWAHSVEYIIEEYQYTTPAEWVSDEARIAFDAVFCSGVRFTDFGNALYFYAPRYCTSEWHESLPFVIEVGGVRFFEEG